MISFLSDTEDLEDILSSLVFEDKPDFFTDETILELVETSLHLMDNFIANNPNLISEPYFHEILLEELKDLFYIQNEDLFDTLLYINYINDIDDIDDIEEDIDLLLEHALNLFIILFYPERSIQTNEPNEPIENEILQIIPNSPIRLPKSISSFIAGFKSAVNTKIDNYIDEHQLDIPKYNKNNHFFQPNYHDHIIRNHFEYQTISNYINNNPMNWNNDKFYV
jgi:hypothetical protein